ncbi:DMT family transporter [Mycolicibacterium aichiense]|uniref:Membrane protein n=1 Tax=Mycolicibacterium aichiense TaxID=1799 RepID=A0AAD1MBW3_9MYCO|nr:DMT family transporter [Mycolicibacterium aichiense]MCV7020339.1 DMT family transporter [Mycolicibacterium aichiense]BBX07848.1 membrane protein [Mycolicibacterium aichiense]STZ81658.1 integral membrane protein [Mycolicibacterium aichiense]
MTTTTAPRTRSWIFYAALLILFWGVWGAFSALPSSKYGYPDEMIYSIWALTMIIPAAVALRGQKWDRRPAATIYGLLIGLTGAGGQLILFQALTMGPAYLIFPIVSISPAITVIMAMVLLRERISPLAVVGLVFALAAIVLFTVTGGDNEGSSGPWLLLSILICVAWGVQAYFMRKSATVGINEATTFGWMTISGLALIPVALISLGGIPTDFPWQAPALAAGTQILNAIGALFLVMALARGKASIVAPTTNALAPALTVIISLIAYQTLPTPYGAIGIVLALVGSTLMVYADEKRGESVTEAVR